MNQLITFSYSTKPRLLGRSLIAIAIALGVVGPETGHCQENSRAFTPSVKHLIDTHIHLYDTDRPEYDLDRKRRVPWPPIDDKVLHKPHLPHEYNRIARPAGVTGVVIVEASPRVGDNKWVLDLVQGDEFYVGLVANIDPFSKRFGNHLRRLKKDPRLVGIRVHLMKAKTGVSRDTQFLANLKLLSEAGLTLDVLMNGRGEDIITEVDEIARALPDMRIVVNHVLGYDIDAQPPSDAWISAVNKLSGNSNVFIKVSGLYQRSQTQPAPHDVNHYRSILDVLWDKFGSQRLIYGSNWPCTKKSGDYASFVQLVGMYFNDKGQKASENFFWRNANKAYNLKLQ